MILEEQFLQILSVPHVSEKASSLMKKYDVAVFVVKKNANKLDIKRSVERLLSTNVYRVCTLNIKGKRKKYGGKKIGKRNDWKKAYIFLESGQKVDFFDKLDNKCLP